MLCSKIAYEIRVYLANQSCHLGIVVAMSVCTRGCMFVPFQCNFFQALTSHDQLETSH